LVRSVADDVLVFGADGVEAECAAVLEAAGVMVAHVPMVGGRLDLRAVLAELGRREMLSVLLEAGSRLNGSFVREDRVDRMVFFHSRTELGSDALPFAEGVALAEIEQRLTLVSRRSFGSDACVAGYLHDAWECADALG
jgi:diaminohydroxyphosphoribosylaminopyrimidine deaminase/5-amino-6-(5-phosphoribosylamino)uracil reductase